MIRNTNNDCLVSSYPIYVKLWNHIYIDWFMYKSFLNRKTWKKNLFSYKYKSERFKKFSFLNKKKLIFAFPDKKKERNFFSKWIFNRKYFIYIERRRVLIKREDKKITWPYIIVFKSIYFSYIILYVHVIIFLLNESWLFFFLLLLKLYSVSSHRHFPPDADIVWAERAPSAWNLVDCSETRTRRHWWEEKSGKSLADSTANLAAWSCPRWSVRLWCEADVKEQNNTTLIKINKKRNRQKLTNKKELPTGSA